MKHFEFLKKIEDLYHLMEANNNPKKEEHPNKVLFKQLIKLIKEKGPASIARVNIPEVVQVGLIKQNPNLILHMPLATKRTKILALCKNPRLIPHVQTNEELLMDIIAERPEAFEFMPNASERLQRYAVELNPLNIKYIPDPSFELQREAIGANPSCFHLIENPPIEIIEYYNNIIDEEPSELDYEIAVDHESLDHQFIDLCEELLPYCSVQIDRSKFGELVEKILKEIARLRAHKKQSRGLSIEVISAAFRRNGFDSIPQEELQKIKNYLEQIPPEYDTEERTKIFVRGGPAFRNKISSELINELFKKFGNITSIRVPMRDEYARGFAFVEFENSDQALRASREMDGFQTEDGEWLEVNLVSDDDRDG